MDDETRITFNKSMRRVSKALQEPDADWEKEFQNFREAIRVAFHGKTAMISNEASRNAFVNLLKHAGCDPKAMWPDVPFGSHIDGFYSWINKDVWEGIRDNPLATMWVDDGWAPVMQQLLFSGQIAFFENLEMAAEKISVTQPDRYLAPFKVVLPKLNEIGFPEDIRTYFVYSRINGCCWTVGNMPRNFPAYHDWMAVGAAAHLIAKTFELGDESAILASSFMFEDPR